MRIDEMAKQFQSVKELQEYCNSQYAVIIALNTKINELQEKLKGAESLLEKAAPLLAEQDGKLEIYKHLSDEMAICLIQIKILKDKSFDSELSFEDTKKLEILTKTLELLKSGAKLPKNPAEELPDDEFRALLEEEFKRNG